MFVRPPQGWDEEQGIVYEVLRPLYGIPNSARALHYTLDRWMVDNGFVRSNFEESVWVRKGDEVFKHDILMSAHIDDTLILCEDLGTLQAFKTHLLSRFEGTDEGEVVEYLGCDIIRDRTAHTLTIRQSAYIRRVLATHGMLDANPVKTPLEPGVRLSRRDAPATPDPALHAQYRAIIGHLSFLVQMTRPDLAFALPSCQNSFSAPASCT